MKDRFLTHLEKLFRTYPIGSSNAPCWFVKAPRSGGFPSADEASRSVVAAGLAWALGKTPLLAGLAALVLVQGIAKEAPKKVSAATQRELWVPTEHLQSVLKKMPRAVMLTPEQYDALLRDSQLAVPNPDADKKLLPPVQATIRDAKFSGTISTGGDVVTMVADYVVESFTDEWAEISLSLPQASMASIEVDAVSALRVIPPKKGAKGQPILVVKGKGKHPVKAVFHIPVKRSPTGNSMVIASPGTAAASLNLNFPDGAELDSALPFVVAVDQPNVAKFVLPAQSGSEFEIRWIARNVAKIPDAAIFQNCQYLYSIDSTRVQADLGFVLNSNLTKLPNRFEIKMAEDVRVLSVEGSELLRWTRLAGGAIEVVLVAGDRDVTDLRVLAEADVKIEDDASDAVIELPIADVLGIHRASGTMALIGADDVRVKNIATGSLTAPIPDDVEGAIANSPNYVASFRFPVAAGATEVTLSKIGEKFKAQMDTLIAMERESVQLTRTLNVIPDEGRTFEIDFDLPDGEELLDVTCGGGRSDFSWVRGERNAIRFSWKAGLSAGAGDSLTITSRRDPEGWFALGNEAMELNFTSATIDGAEALSGYVAVSFNESFRVETETAEGLDPRDSRTTPIAGTLAWFRLSDFNLTLNASRRATEIEASHTAYALPLASNLEIEGQVDLGIRYTPIGEIGITFPVEIAELVRFDSPLLSEKTLNAETGEWTLDFHDELIGPQRFRYRMSLPFEVEEVGKDSDQKRFEIALPVVKVPAAKRLRGDWVLEANTDTELTFEANGLDAVDSLRVPAVSGYQPRHRVIAAYRYRGDSWSLKLAGTRHAHEDLVSTVIDDLRIDTVVSTDGDERHQAMMSLRTTGEQFLEIGLPKDSVLWMLKVDAETVKPIRAAPGTIRVQLPAHENANARAISVKLIYQTPGRKWRGSGKEKLQPIRMADRIPIMRTKWFLHLPEGYDYQKFESNLSEEFEVVDRTLLGYAGDEFGRWSRSRPTSNFAFSLFESESAEMKGDVSIDALLSSASSKPAPITDQNGNEILIDALPPEIQGQILMNQSEMETGQGPLRVDAIGRIHPDETKAKEEGVPGVASRYVIRLQERVKKADESALRGSQLMADEDYEGAFEQYRAGIDLLPEANLTKSRRDAYIKQAVSAGVKLAEQRAAEARYGEVTNVLAEVLKPSVDPDNLEAKRLLERLQDSEWYSPELTPSHLEKVRRIEYANKVAQRHLDLGDYESAEKTYFEALNQDPYNSAARKSLAAVEEERERYYDTARDQTRATFRRKVAEGWEMPVPVGGSVPNGSDISEADVDTMRRDYLATVKALEERTAEVIELDKKVRDTSLAENSRGEDLEMLSEKTASIQELKKREEAFGNQLMMIAQNRGVDFGGAFGNDKSGRLAGNASGVGSGAEKISHAENKLKQIILPSVEFVDTPLNEALQFLQQRAVELDTAEADPTRKGLNFILDAGSGAAPAPAAGGGGFGVDSGVGATRITLRLKNVPLVEALRYTTSLAQMKYKVEPNAVLIVPLSRPDDKLYTNTYTVPPGFLTAGNRIMGGGGAAADAFADPIEAVRSGPMGATEVLEAAGVTFPPGGSASYNSQTGQLIVRTTQDQMELVEIFNDTLNPAPLPGEPGTFPVTPATPTDFNQFGFPTEYNPPELPNQVGNKMQQFFGQKAIDQLNPNWRKVPVLDQVPTIGRLFQSDEVVITENRIELGKMKINDLNLQGKTVEEALGLIREKTLAEGVDAAPVGTHSATSRSKLVKFIYQEPENAPPSGVDPAIKNKLDLKLLNVTVLEALDQISKASGTHFRVTPDGIAFAPKQVTLEPMQTIFIELPESEFKMPDGNGGSLPAHARYVLRDAGIKFPTGSSAAYNPATGRLAVRNTRPNLEAIASHYAAFLNVESREAHAASRAETFEREFLGGAADLKGFDLADIGRLPIDFVLPESGRSYSFTGLVAPESIEFRFVNWERQIRFAWIWILVGGLAFWFGAFKKLQKPIFVGLVGVVLLTFVPLVISQSLLAFCNALLIGWLVAAAIWVVWRLSQVSETREVSV